MDEERVDLGVGVNEIRLFDRALFDDDVRIGWNRRGTILSDHFSSRFVHRRHADGKNFITIN